MKLNLFSRDYQDLPEGQDFETEKEIFGNLVVKALNGCQTSIEHLSIPIGEVYLRDIVRQGLKVSLGIEYPCFETREIKYTLGEIIVMEDPRAHLLPERVALSTAKRIEYYNQ